MTTVSVFWTVAGAFCAAVLWAWFRAAARWLDCLDRELDSIERVVNDPWATQDELFRAVARLHVLNETVLARQTRRDRLTTKAGARYGMS